MVRIFIFVISVVCILFGAVSSFPKRETEREDALIKKDVIGASETAKAKSLVKRDLGRNAVSDKSMRWPNGRVPYEFRGFTADGEATILQAMEEIEADVNGTNPRCIQFVEKTASDKNYVEIFNGADCASDVGFQNNGRQESSISTLCLERGPIMHELLHVLGFYHEQTRVDRDDYVDIDMTNVNNAVNFDKAVLGSQDTLDTPYDYSSIMHYGPYFMATDRSKPVLTPKADKAAGVMIGQRLSLSEMDVLRVQRLYECTEDTTKIIHQEANAFVSYTFENEDCQMIVNNPGAWKSVTGESANGPKAGHTNGIDSYLIAEESVNGNKKVKISTPLFAFEQSCVDFFLYQKGPSSFLSIEVNSVSLGMPYPLFKAKHFADRWQHIRFDLAMPTNFEVNMTLVADISSGDVAVDDLIIYKGTCN